MASIHPPQHRRRHHEKISASDEFWCLPISLEDHRIAAAALTASTAATGDDHNLRDDDDDHIEFEMLSLPPAHRQLLSPDAVASEDLKGYDHALEAANDDCHDAEPSRGLSLSAVKRRGGGSWLLGFARLGDGLVSPAPLPGLVRVPTDDSSLASDGDSSDDRDDLSASPPAGRPCGVSFSPCVHVQPVPHSSDLGPAQRRRMYSSSVEVRRNKTRNKREYRHDGYDWRNATEEWEMGVDMVTGELVHPVHELHC